MALAARAMGLHTIVWDPHPSGPAQEAADGVIVGPYDSEESLESFSQAIGTATYEFENIPYATASALGEKCPVFPPPELLWVSQNRLREKDRARSLGLKTTPFGKIANVKEAERIAQEIGLPGILKTLSGGYDGKGQIVVKSVAEAGRAFEALYRHEPLIYEKMVPFVKEVSVLVARDQFGALAIYPLVENHHQGGILDWSLAPARVSPAVTADAVLGARTLANSLNLVGVMAVEYFVTPDGEVLFNELAPRPHNSGHWTIEGAWPSQFTQHMRAVAGWPVLAPRQLSPAVMVNLMGERFMDGLDRLEEILPLNGVQLHWYGKIEMRPGRKVGHVTVLGNTPGEALQQAQAVKRMLGGEWYDGA